MNRKIIIYFITILYSAIGCYEVFANNTVEPNSKYKDEYGVLKQHLNTLNVYLEKGVFYADLEVYKEHEIFDDKNLNLFATESVYHHFFRQLTYLEAGTLVPNGKDYKKIPTTNIKIKASSSANVFYDDSKHSEISFTNLKKGHKTYFKYKVKFQDVRMLQNIMLQDNLPTELFKLTLNIPTGLTIHDEIINEQTFNNVKKSIQSSKNKTTIIWEAQDIPAIKFLPHVPSQLFNVAHLSIRLGQYKKSETDNPITFLTTPKDLSIYLHSFVKDINKTTDPTITSVVNELCKNITTPYDKAEAIYNWVQQNIRYIAYEDSLGGFIPREASLIIKRKFGDCKDMSSLLKVMCESAGIDAKYTWIGTDILPYSIAKTPVPSVFNHMICAVKINNEWLFLDATDNEIPFGFIPSNLQGKEAFIYNDDLNFIIYKLPFESSNKHTLIDTTFATIDNTSLVGKTTTYAQGSIAWDFRMSLKYESAKNYDKKIYNFIKRGNNKFTLDKYEYNLDKLEDKGLVITSNFTIPNYISSYNQNYFINLNLSRPLDGINFELKDRKIPIYFDGVKQLKHITILELPKGYKVKQLPPNIEEKYKNIGSVQINYKQIDQQLIFNHTIVIDNPIIDHKDFETLKNMVQLIQSNYKETIEIYKN